MRTNLLFEPAMNFRGQILSTRLIDSRNAELKFANLEDNNSLVTVFLEGLSASTAVSWQRGIRFQVNGVVVDDGIVKASSIHPLEF